MFRPGNLGHIGRLGLVAASQPTLVAQALAILAKYGSAANLYLPGVGAINGITAGNWLDSAGTTAAAVDGQVGRVDNARGGAHLTQSTAANRPILRLAGGVFSWQFDGNNDSFASTMTTGNEGWVCAGTNVQALNPAGAMFVGNGAFSATGSPGMMIYSHGAGGGGFMQLWLSNGVSRQFVGSTATPTGSAFVFDGGWDASSAAIAINGVEQNLVKTIDPTSAQTIRIGIDPGLFWMLNGLIFATIIMPTVRPTATERATLRKFIAALSGVTL